MKPIRRSAGITFAFIVATAIVLSGCASPTSSDELDSVTATALQQSVVEVATLAADGDVAAALDQLDALQSELDDAVASDQLSAERASAIQQAIDLVRIDLEALVPTPTPSPSVTEEKPDNGDNGDNGDKDDRPGKPGKP